MRLNWFGLIGVICLALFLSFFVSPKIWTVPSHRFAESAFPLIMVASIIFPAIASIRSGKWWLAVSIAGFIAAMRFFWLISA
jgi:hypothetical protein